MIPFSMSLYSFYLDCNIKDTHTTMSELELLSTEDAEAFNKFHPRDQRLILDVLALSRRQGSNFTDLQCYLQEMYAPSLAFKLLRKVLEKKFGLPDVAEVMHVMNVERLFVEHREYMIKTGVTEKEMTLDNKALVETLLKLQKKADREAARQRYGFPFALTSEIKDIRERE